MAKLSDEELLKQYEDICQDDYEIIANTEQIVKLREQILNLMPDRMGKPKTADVLYEEYRLTNWDWNFPKWVDLSQEKRQVWLDKIGMGEGGCGGYGNTRTSRHDKTHDWMSCRNPMDKGYRRLS